MIILSVSPSAGVAVGAGPPGPLAIAVPIPFAFGINAVSKAPATTVVEAGATYMCVVDHVTTNSFDPTKWQVIAAKGEPGADSIFLTVKVNGRSPDLAGNINIGVNDLLDAAPIASPQLQGAPTAPTADTSTNNTQLASTAFVKNVAALYQPISEKAVANGYASLDATGKLPSAQLPASLIGSIIYQQTWNATTNTPTIPTAVGNLGEYYIVAVAGSTNIDGITTWNVGDVLISNGTVWQRVPQTQVVFSVAGRTGTVTLTAADIAAGTFPAGTFNLTSSTVNVTTQAAADNTTKAASTAMVQSAIAASVAMAWRPQQCRLVKIGNDLVLSRYNGKYATVNDVVCTLASGGSVLTPSGTTQDTLYYIYGTESAGVITLEFSTTGYTISASTGFPTMTGNAAKALFGAARGGGTNGTWSTIDTLLISWYNPLPKSYINLLNPGVTSTTPLEMASSMRVPFISLGSRPIDLSFNGSGYQSLAQNDVYIGIGIDNATNIMGRSIQERFVEAGATYQASMHMSKRGIVVADGYHYATPVGHVSGGSTSFINSGVEVTVLG